MFSGRMRHTGFELRDGRMSVHFWVLLIILPFLEEAMRAKADKAQTVALWWCAGGAEWRYYCNNLSSSACCL